VAALLLGWAAVTPLLLAPVVLWLAPRALAAAEAAGGWAPVAYVAVVPPLLALALVPASLAAALAGALFGPAGLLPAAAAYLLAAWAAREAVRRPLRDAVQGAIARSPAAAAFQAELTRADFRLVVLSRLSPTLPFAFWNVLLALAPVPGRTYLAGSLLGMLPRTAAAVLVGAAAGPVIESLGDAPGRLAGPGGWWLPAVGLLATAWLAVAVARAAGRVRRLLASPGAVR
jgi:uncharacterized membrane protein YdjX (TVP38/TMEM64 family)